MSPPAPALTLLALVVPAVAFGDVPAPVRVAQLTIHERIVIRIPALPVGRTPIDAPVTWKETKGPKCIAVATLAGALITSPRAVDLVLQGGKRVRARLDGDCKPLDFYSGFYLRPAADGMVCADRDAIRVRSGASCDIDVFRTLVAKR